MPSERSNRWDFLGVGTAYKPRNALPRSQERDFVGRSRENGGNPEITGGHERRQISRLKFRRCSQGRPDTKRHHHEEEGLPANRRSILVPSRKRTTRSRGPPGSLRAATTSSSSLPRPGELSQKEKKKAAHFVSCYTNGHLPFATGSQLSGILASLLPCFLASLLPCFLHSNLLLATRYCRLLTNDDLPDSGGLRKHARLIEANACAEGLR